MGQKAWEKRIRLKVIREPSHSKLQEVGPSLFYAPVKRGPGFVRKEVNRWAKQVLFNLRKEAQIEAFGAWEEASGSKILPSPPKHIIRARFLESVSQWAGFTPSFELRIIPASKARGGTTRRVGSWEGYRILQVLVAGRLRHGTKKSKFKNCNIQTNLLWRKNSVPIAPGAESKQIPSSPSGTCRRWRNQIISRASLLQNLPRLFPTIEFGITVILKEWKNNFATVNAPRKASSMSTSEEKLISVLGPL